MSDPRIDKIAIALRDCAETFDCPVDLYVQPEALKRARDIGPDIDHVDDLESWRILARAALAVLP